MKTDILGFLHEADRVALRVAPEAVVEPLAVIDVKARGSFFLVERAGGPHVALGLVRLSVVPDHLAACDL